MVLGVSRRFLFLDSPPPLFVFALFPLAPPFTPSTIFLITTPPFLPLTAKLPPKATALAQNPKQKSPKLQI